LPRRSQTNAGVRRRRARGQEVPFGFQPSDFGFLSSFGTGHSSFPLGLSVKSPPFPPVRG
jgi:hypothetical protein